MNERNPSGRAVLWTVMAGVATLILLVGGYIANNSNSSATGNGGSSADCWKVVTTSGGAGDRVITAGVSGTPQQVRAKLLKAAQHDPVALVVIFNATPPVVKANGGSLSMAGLTKDGCYTDTAKSAWIALATEFSKANMTTGTAPATGCNAFVVKGKPIYKCGAITGNRTGTKIVWSDGTVTWILWRCANPVTPKPPVPPKPPTPTPTPTPKPTPSCVKPPVPGPGNYEYNPSDCTWHKKPTSWECQQNGGPNCPPNQATQPPQHNPGQPTGPSGPSTEPSPAPSWTSSSTPPPNGGGYDGGSHAPGPTPSNSAEVDPTATPTGYATGMPN